MKEAVMGNSTRYAFAFLTISLSVVGCTKQRDRESETSKAGEAVQPVALESKATETTVSDEATTTTAGETETGTRPASIVFVGKKDACDCTRDRIDTSWNALRTALKDRQNLPLQRIQLDVDMQEAQRLANLKPLMAAPGIYFLDDKGGLVEMLQGEVSEAQLAAVLDER